MRTKKCKSCQEEILYYATVCFHCNSDQTFFGRLSKHVQTPSLIISIGLLILAYLQFNESNQDRIKSTEALKIANAYKVDAQKMAKEINRQRQEMISTLATLKATQKDLDSVSRLMVNTTLLSLQNQWIIGNNSFFVMNPNSPNALRFYSNSEALVKQLLKNEKYAKKWWDKTGGIIHQRDKH